MSSIPGTIVDFIKITYEADKPQVLAMIQGAEGGVEAVIVQAIEAMPPPRGLLGTLFSMLRPQLETYVKNLVATAGPEVVFNFIDAALIAEDKALGGGTPTVTKGP